MSHIRFRRIIEIQYREYRKIGGYFNRQNRKQVYKVWVRAKKQGFTQLDFNEFYWKIVTAGSNGVSYHEMKMNSKALDKYFKRWKESGT